MTSAMKFEGEMKDDEPYISEVTRQSLRKLFIAYGKVWECVEAGLTLEETIQECDCNGDVVMIEMISNAHKNISEEIELDTNASE